MPGAEEMALFDRIGALIRGEDDRFDLIVFDTAPTGHTLRLIRMPELMEAWIRALSRRAAPCSASSRRRDGSGDDVAGRAPRAPARVPGAAAHVRATGVRARPRRRAAADRGNGPRDRATGGCRRRRSAAWSSIACCPRPAPIRSCDRRHEQELIYLDEIDRRFAKHARVRVPQLPSDVHGVRDARAPGRASDRRERPSHMTINRPDPLSSPRSMPATSARFRTAARRP